MGRPVQFAAVQREIARFGPRASVVTVTADGEAHVVTSLVRVGEGRLFIDVGARTRANLAARPRVTLTWMPPDGGDYQLILDGAAVRLGEADAAGLSEAEITVDRGILHRLAGTAGSPASCVVLSDER